MLSNIKHCKCLNLQKILKHTNIKNKYFIYFSFCNVYNEKNINYFDYDEDLKLLKRLQNNEIDDILNINDERNILKIKKKYLKLLKVYHPDVYMKEKNEKRKKNKEEIFLQIYKKYKSINEKYQNTYDTDINDESIYENEEEKSERLEKYKRYSEGKRNDVNHKYLEIYILIGILSTFCVVFLICIYLPFNIDNYKEEFHDSSENNKVEILSCFYNPAMKRYEYFSDNFLPPHPYQLYHFYKNMFPNLSLDEDILKLKYFEVVKLPKNRAKKARLLYDKKRNELIFLKKKKKIQLKKE
ncbi:conserved Plasmodium protein, unknown function [Plasmodium gallinaceum]|uniref:J domain-containing protein n=1 Tax=Plasmodium gallinaceum TaxID=5849 RepID=A0A1J1GM78_PLAGA|nr:conserved Plasmodium protein, unknown function [Plasmodium gallinaceum]CRG93341.1 conserved Plasmodium protein, unknown function [Plasmodium gallinaceum]